MTKKDNSAKELTHRQLKLISLLVSSHTQEDALKQAKLSRQTLSKWTKNPRFMEELRSRRNETIEQAFDSIKANAIAAADVLVTLLSSSNESVRRHAAIDILDRVLRIRELNEVESRICDLEQIFFANRR